MNIKTIFRGREIWFKSKAGKELDLDDEEQLGEYRHWLKIYDFIYDITDNIYPKRGDKND